MDNDNLARKPELNDEDEINQQMRARATANAPKGGGNLRLVQNGEGVYDQKVEGKLNVTSKTGLDIDINKQVKAKKKSAHLRLIQGGLSENQINQEDIDQEAVAYDETSDDTSDDTTEEGGEASEAESDELSPSELKDREAIAANTKTAEDNEAVDEAEAGFVNDDKALEPGGLSAKKKKGIAGGLIATGLITSLTFMFTIFSGPAQFIHLSQMMQKFHMSSPEDNADSRLMKFARAIKNRKSFEKNRLGIVGNKLADHFTTTFEKSGVKMSYDKGIFLGYEIDAATFAKNSTIDGLKDASPDDIASYFKENLGVNASLDETGRMFIDSDQLSGTRNFFKARSAVKLFFRNANISKIGAAIGYRNIKARQGLTLNPIKNLEAAAYKNAAEKLKAYEDAKAAEIEAGQADADIGNAHPGEDADGNSTPPAEDAIATQEGAEKASKALGALEGAKYVNGKIQGLSENFTTEFKAAGGLSLLTGVLCMMQGFSAQYDKISYNNIALPMMREAVDVVSTGDAIKGYTALSKPLDTDQLSYLGRRLTDPATGQPWSYAKSIQAENGEPQTGPDIPDEARISSKGNPVTEALSKIVGLPQLCSAANSALGQVATFGIDIVTGGGVLGPILAQIGSRTVVPLISDHVLAAITSDPMKFTQTVGPDLGSVTNWGMRLSTNDSLLRAGGRILSGTEELTLRQQQQADDREEFSHRSLADRLFDYQDSRSVAGKLIDDQSTNYGSNLARMASSFLNVSGSLGKFASFLQPHIFAAEQPYDYGFPRIGFTRDELEDPRLDDPLANAGQVKEIFKSNSGLKKRAEECFGVKIADDLTVTSEGPAMNYGELEKSKCADQDFNWMRVRMFVLDSQTGESFACYYKTDPKSCTNVGMGT